MAKDKKKLKIKTSRYFTKTCSSCGKEYPNWFTTCPNCGTPWDQSESVSESVVKKEEPATKTIKIVVKITEDDFDEKLIRVQLIFSADQGKTWYQMAMDTKRDYYIAEIAEVPLGSVIIYYIDVYLANGEKVIENNDGRYYYYQVGVPTQELKEEPTQEETKTIKDHVDKIPPQESPKEYASDQDDDVTIFGRPQTEKDPNLKTCPHCQSKIKQMWSVCPICGKPVG